ncbi:hypothetical protein BDF21DRAFT_400108 [Thamnidium elegans]|nr:hypothetical protein BDF21DRAFT_400108 [Thamnidium elegans]
MDPSNTCIVYVTLRCPLNCVLVSVSGTRIVSLHLPFSLSGRVVCVPGSTWYPLKCLEWHLRFNPFCIVYFVTLRCPLNCVLVSVSGTRIVSLHLPFSLSGRVLPPCFLFPVPGSTWYPLKCLEWHLRLYVSTLLTAILKFLGFQNFVTLRCPLNCVLVSVSGTRIVSLHLPFSLSGRVVCVPGSTWYPLKCLEWHLRLYVSTLLTAILKFLGFQNFVTLRCPLNCVLVSVSGTRIVSLHLPFSLSGRVVCGS